MSENEEQKPKTPRLTAAKKSEIAEAVANRLLSDKKFLETTADKLLASKPFTRRIVLALLLVGLITAAVYAGLGFLALKNAMTKTDAYLTNQFTTYVRTNDFEVSNRLFIARREVTNQITKEFETERIKSIVTDVASNRANAILTIQLLPEIERFRGTISNELQLVAQNVRDLTNASAFAITVLAANGNDRSAFERLKRWAGDTNFIYSSEAERSVQAIIEYFNIRAATTSQAVNFLPPWGSDSDPKKTFDEMKLLYTITSPPSRRMGLLQAMAKRDDLTKSSRLSFFIFAMHQEQDLAVLSMAGQMFRETSAFNLRTLQTELFLKWWDDHNQELLKEEAATKAAK